MYHRFPLWIASRASGVGQGEIPCVQPLLPPCHISSFFQSEFIGLLVLSIFILQLSAMDVLARIPMKGAAKCDEHCELQNSVNQ